MRLLNPKRLACALVLVFLGGCLHPVAERVDSCLCTHAQHPIDLEPLLAADRATTARSSDSGLRPVSAQEEKKDTGDQPRQTLTGRLKVDPNLPGAKAPDIQLPPIRDTPPEKLNEAI